MATTSRALFLPSLLLLFFASIISRHQLFLFAHAKTKLNIKTSGIDMVHASHILCGSNRTLCEDVMEWLEPFTEDDSMRPKLERGFEELARRFSRCPTGKRNGGDLGYFPRGEMTKDFDGTQRRSRARERKRARLLNEFLNMLFCLVFPPRVYVLTACFLTFHSFVFLKRSYRLLGTRGAVAQTGRTASNVQRIPRDYGPRPSLGERGNARASASSNRRSKEETRRKFREEHEERERESGEKRRQSAETTRQKTADESSRGDAR
jgi:hypothetical protein